MILDELRPRQTLSYLPFAPELSPYLEIVFLSTTVPTFINSPWILLTPVEILILHLKCQLFRLYSCLRSPSFLLLRGKCPVPLKLQSSRLRPRDIRLMFTFRTSVAPET